MKERAIDQHNRNGHGDRALLVRIHFCVDDQRENNTGSLDKSRIPNNDRLGT